MGWRLTSRCTFALRRLLPRDRLTDLSNLQSGTLFAAAGDNNCYAFDLSTGKLMATLWCVPWFTALLTATDRDLCHLLSGHTNYLHAVLVLKHSHQLATAAEDGFVRLWDMRSGHAANGM